MEIGCFGFKDYVMVSCIPWV